MLLYIYYIWDQFGVIWDHLGIIWDHLGTIWDHLGESYIFGEAPEKAASRETFSKTSYFIEEFVSPSLDWLAWLGLARLASAWLVSSAAATTTATTPEQASTTTAAAL